jgi:hypothetical protein
MDSIARSNACNIGKTVHMFTLTRRETMKRLLAAVLLLVSGFAQATESRLSDPFTVGIAGKVCIQGKCKAYSDLKNVRVSLSPNPSNPSSFEGHAGFEYVIEGVSLSSAVYVSDFVYNGNHQINLFLKTSITGSNQDLGSSELIVSKLSELNSIAQYSVPVTRGSLTIEPAIIVGANQSSVLSKIRALLR